MSCRGTDPNFWRLEAQRLITVKHDAAAIIRRLLKLSQNYYLVNDSQYKIIEDAQKWLKEHSPEPPG